tara:strand:+ start:799 stop:1026 length:228 start_codon:yes stop_codon:yes gene_type:complete
MMSTEDRVLTLEEIGNVLIDSIKELNSIDLNILMLEPLHSIETELEETQKNLEDISSVLLDLYVDLGKNLEGEQA